MALVKYFSNLSIDNSFQLGNIRFIYPGVFLPDEFGRTVEGSWTRTCSSKGKFLRGEPVRFTMKFRYTRPFAEPMCQPEIDDFTFLSPPRNSNFLRDDWINFPPFFSPETITMHLIAMQNDRSNRGIAKERERESRRLLNRSKIPSGRIIRSRGKDWASNVAGI